MFKDNYNAADTATLTPSRLLMTGSNNNNEWSFNAPSVNDFDSYMNEVNPFDNNPAMFEQKFTQSASQDIVNMAAQQQEYKQHTFIEAPPTPPTDAPQKKQRKKLLEKNREAAYRCRQKKKRWVNDLEERSENVENRNKELQEQVAQLREESIYLRNLLLTHGNCDCDVVQTYLRRTSEQLTNNAIPSHLPALIGSSSSVSGSESSSSSAKQFYTMRADQQTFKL